MPYTNVKWDLPLITDPLGRLPDSMLCVSLYHITAARHSFMRPFLYVAFHLLDSLFEAIADW